MAETMKIWTMDGLGRERLELRTAPIPRPRPGELLVQVSAASLNYRDKFVIETGGGLPLAFPFTPVSDMAGVVVEAGADATRFGVGARVMTTFKPGWIDGVAEGIARVPPAQTLGGTHPGMLAQYVALPQDWLVAAPASVDDAEASTLPCAGLTAWCALIERGHLHAGQTVLVQGTGGVALFGLQIARAHGAEVIVTSGSPEKLQRAHALGANHIVDRTKEDWVEAVWRLTADRGVDHILEIVGGPHLGRAIEAVAIGGRISLIGVLEGFDISGSAAPMLRKAPVIEGIAVGHRRALEDLARAVDSIGLKPVIGARYPFAGVRAALDHLDRGPFGKIVIDVAEA